MLRRLLKPLILPTTLIVVLLAGLFTAMDYYAALAPSSESSAPRPEIVEPSEDDSGSGRRDVAPDASLPRMDEDRPLTRLPPREPLTPPAEERPQAASTLLHRPLAISAGVLSFGGRDLEIAGVLPTEPDRLCTTPDGERWPCGMVARTAFRNYLRGRSLDCDVPDADWQGTASAACRMMEADIGLWLAQSGWAEAEVGSPYADAAAEAREARRGIYGADPR
jgi:hypothetical protein